MSFALWLSVILLVLICAFLIMLVLIQKGRGGGLSSAFGGAGGNTAFGSKTGDVLTWATSVVFGIFLVLSVVSNLVANKIHAIRTGGTASAAVTPTPAAPNSPMPFSPGGGLTPVNPTTPEQPPSSTQPTH
jgi:preprotein translocase subunit SecG